ncbi:class A beta-lactamase [Streptomyces sp. PU-14G]|uniref:class A beta-lactamase n=1 Tax=Streptomyces sp. PU-14G TaxID=2800808 RepID=UPI0034DF40DA
MRTRKTRVTLLAVPVLLSGLISGCGEERTAGAEAPPAASAVPSASAGARTPARITSALATLEKRHDRRLGLYVVDTGTGRTVEYHADERFGFCSTAKVLQAAALLEHADDAELDQVVTYERDDLLDHAPLTKKHLGTGMSVRDLMKAALQYSDNTAANLLFEQLGGPAGLQQKMRDLGDETSVFDRTEPDLNDTPPGTTRDTSTPRALGDDLRRFLLGDALAPDRRKLLATWMRGNTTGDDLVRAGVPAGWKVADKTGSGLTYGTQNDIAVAWRPHGAPVIIALMSRGHDRESESDKALLAEATKAALPGVVR